MSGLPYIPLTREYYEDPLVEGLSRRWGLAGQTIILTIGRILAASDDGIKSCRFTQHLDDLADLVYSDPADVRDMLLFIQRRKKGKQDTIEINEDDQVTIFWPSFHKIIGDYGKKKLSRWGVSNLSDIVQSCPTLSDKVRQCPTKSDNAPPKGKESKSKTTNAREPARGQQPRPPSAAQLKPPPGVVVDAADHQAIREVILPNYLRLVGGAITDRQAREAWILFADLLRLHPPDKIAGLLEVDTWARHYNRREPRSVLDRLPALAAGIAGGKTEAGKRQPQKTVDTSESDRHFAGVPRCACGSVLCQDEIDETKADFGEDHPAICWTCMDGMRRGRATQ